MAVRHVEDTWHFEGLRPGIAFVVGYRKGAVDWADRQAPLLPGEVRRIRPRTPLLKSLAGRVEDPDGRPIPFARVSLYEREFSDPVVRRTRADGTFRFGPSRPGTMALLEVRAEGFGAGGRRGDVQGGDPTIRLCPLRPVGIRVVTPAGEPVRAFEVLPWRPDHWKYRPAPFCVVGEETRPGAVTTQDGFGLVNVLTGHAGGVTIVAGDRYVQRWLGAGAAGSEVTVTLREQVTVIPGFPGGVAWTPGLFVRIAEAPGRSDVGWTTEAVEHEHSHLATFADFILDPGRYTFELGVTDPDGLPSIRERKTLDVARPETGDPWLHLDFSPASCAPGPDPDAEARGQEELDIVARWPDGLAAVRIPLGLYGFNGLGRMERIDGGETDDAGMLTLDAAGGSGRAEIRVEDSSVSWKQAITLPSAKAIEITLPPPQEIAITLHATEPEAFEDVSFTAWSEHGSDVRFQRAGLERYACRSLTPAAFTLNFSDTWGAFIVRPRSELKLTGPQQAAVTSPARLEFEAIRKRRVTVRVVTAGGRPVPEARVQWKFLPASRNDVTTAGLEPAGADGWFRMWPPESWTREGAPEGAMVRLAADDLRLRKRVEVERPWPASGDLDLGDLIVEPGTGCTLQILDDAGHPIAGAQVLGGAEEALGRIDSSGGVTVAAVRPAPRWVRARGHVPKEVNSDLFGIDELQTIVLERTASVEVVFGAESDSEAVPCLHSAPGERPLSIDAGVRRCRSGGDGCVPAVRHEKGIWTFEGLRPGVRFVVAFRGAVVDGVEAQAALGPGETRQVRPPPGFHRATTGRVLDEAGRPVPFALVTHAALDGTRSVKVVRRSRADGSYRIPARLSGPRALLEVRAEGYAANGRRGDAIGAAEPIRLFPLRQMKIRAAAAVGTPIPAFTVGVWRPDLREFSPPLLPGCSVGDPPAGISAENGEATVMILPDDRAGVTIYAGGKPYQRRIAPGETEVTAVTREQVPVALWIRGLPSWTPGLFVRIAAAPRPGDVGLRIPGLDSGEIPWSLFAAFAVDPGRYTFEFCATGPDGQQSVREVRTVDLVRPDPAAGDPSFHLEWKW